MELVPQLVPANPKALKKVFVERSTPVETPEFYDYHWSLCLDGERGTRIEHKASDKEEIIGPASCTALVETSGCI